MISYELSFCKVKKLDDSICEIIANEGIEMNLVTLEELFQWMKDNLSLPCGILVNKLNNYTYTFDTQLKLLDFPGLKATAVVTYSRISKVATESMTKLPTNESWNLKTFDDRELAYEWLISELKD